MFSCRPLYSQADPLGILQSTPNRTQENLPPLRQSSNYYETTIIQTSRLYNCDIYMFRKILKRSRDLIITSILFGTAVYANVYCRCNSNKKQYLQAIESDTLKDTSRLSNDSFGISWGFQADDTIMSRIDSGDLLFIRFQCYECISPASMFKCYYKTCTYLEQQFHTVGCAFRDESGLYILINEFGETKVINYTQLISLPYIKSLNLQKREKGQSKIHVNLRKEVDFQRSIPESQEDYLTRVKKLLNVQHPVTKVQDLMTGENQINIRTETNATLRSL